MRQIYVDHSATTPVDPEVFNAMIPHYNDSFGNASSVPTPPPDPRRCPFVKPHPMFSITLTMRLPCFHSQTSRPGGIKYRLFMFQSPIRGSKTKDLC